MVIYFFFAFFFLDLPEGRKIFFLVEKVLRAAWISTQADIFLFSWDFNADSRAIFALRSSIIALCLANLIVVKFNLKKIKFTFPHTLSIQPPVAS